MVITLYVDGVRIEVADAQEAAKLLRALREPEAAMRPAVPSPVEKAPELPQQFVTPGLRRLNTLDMDPEFAALTLRFLEAIESGGPDGITSESLLPLFRVTQPKALGSKLAPINRFLEDLGFKRKAVYLNPKTPSGRSWRAGRRLREAISAVRPLASY